MNDVNITIHPQGWLFVAVVILVAFANGYVWGYWRGWRCMKRKWEANTFEFEQQKEKA